MGIARGAGGCVLRLAGAALGAALLTGASAEAPEADALWAQGEPTACETIPSDSLASLATYTAPSAAETRPWAMADAGQAQSPPVATHADSARVTVTVRRASYSTADVPEPEVSTVSAAYHAGAPVRRLLPSPAERLGLDAAARAREETCLAQAIYFEARGEDVRGQEAVAQVIMNRVFSPHYPDSVCGVVYQNAQHHNACQFSFACDRKPDVVRDEQAWALAQSIATQALDGDIWDSEIGHATHYHATFVNPWWVGTMNRLASHGVHIFYRPTRWGSGAEDVAWSRVAPATRIASALH
jgi:hypothetical protein